MNRSGAQPSRLRAGAWQTSQLVALPRRIDAMVVWRVARDDGI